MCGGCNYAPPVSIMGVAMKQQVFNRFYAYATLDLMRLNRRIVLRLLWAILPTRTMHELSNEFWANYPGSAYNA